MSTVLNNSSIEEATKFLVNVIKFSTLNKYVFDSECALTSRALRLVCT